MPPAASTLASVRLQEPNAFFTHLATSTIARTTVVTVPEASVDSVENKIRAHVFAKRIRLVDLFADFDKLRSGHISAAQFRRCLGGAMERGVPLTEQEYKVLMDFYRGKTKDTADRIKWVDFTDSIDKVFGAKRLESTPTLYTPPPHEVVKPVRPPLPPKSEAILKDVIERLRQYVKHHGSDVKSWFKDFDKYNGGYITQNQFRRGIPQNVMSQEEEDLLLGQYSDDVTGSVNYFKMNTDVNRKEKPHRARMDHAKLIEKLSNADHVENEHVPIGTEELLHAVGSHWGEKPSSEFVENYIKKQVYKNRIRLIEFFRDYDKHNCGLVTEAQFRAGLRLSNLSLDTSQINTVIQAYQGKDGRVAYRKLCRSVEEIFTKNNLESNPLEDVKPPPREFLAQGCNQLPPHEEERCKEIIARFRTSMKERRLLLLPFFRDFDYHLSYGNSGTVTRSHFSRILSSMRLNVSDSELHILFKKFEDGQSAKVYYMEFVRAIDPETYASTPPASPGVPETGSASRRSSVANSAASFDNLMSRIRYHAATKRIRVSEFFRDFDKLRCYSIPRHEFVRGINRIGLSLTPKEYEDLADAYADKSGKKGTCRWKDFDADIERVFNDTHLESQPTRIPHVEPVESNPFLTPNTLTREEQQKLNEVLSKLAEHWKTRRTSIKPFFKDFDKLCTGHVTKTQFRQCLTYLQVDVSDEEFEILCKKWNKSTVTRANENEYGVDSNEEISKPVKERAERICYLMFLAELTQELDKISDDQQETKNASEPEKQTTKITSVQTLNADEVKKLLTRIKVKAKTERIRVIDVMADFDHLRHGKITKNEFRRALRVIFIDLTEPELATLETIYQNNYDPGMVNYVQFSDAVESVFTAKGLIREPTMEPTPFVGYESGNVDQSLNILTESENQILNKVIGRLREKVRQRRIDVLSYLEDFDFVREGSITTNQFRSVLGSINLPVDDAEITVLARRFTVDKNLDRLKYRAFAAMITGGSEAAERHGGIW